MTVKDDIVRASVVTRYSRDGNFKQPYVATTLQHPRHNLMYVQTVDMYSD